MTGHHSLTDISPTRGTLEFRDGQDLAVLTLTVHDDQKPELEETTLVTLDDVYTIDSVADGHANLGMFLLLRETL